MLRQTLPMPVFPLPADWPLSTMPSAMFAENAAANASGSLGVVTFTDTFPTYQELYYYIRTMHSR